MGESYDRYSAMERYLPRYEAAAPGSAGGPVGGHHSAAAAAAARYLVDPYSRRDLYPSALTPGVGPPPPPAAPAPSAPAPPRYLRPLHRYTPPRPARIEYRTHVEYLGSSGGSPLSERCRRLILLEKLRQEYMLREKEELQSDIRYVRTPPLGRTVEEPPLTPGRSVVAGGGGGGAPGGRGGVGAAGEPLSLCCGSATTPRRLPPPMGHHLPPPPPPSLSTPAPVTTSPSIWRNVGPSPPSPSPSPPSQTNSSTPPSMMDSGVYSRSGPSSSETPSSCSSIAPTVSGGGGGTTERGSSGQQQQTMTGGGSRLVGGSELPTSSDLLQASKATGQQQHPATPLHHFTSSSGHHHSGSPYGGSQQQQGIHQRPQLITQRSMPVTEAEHLRAVSTTEILKEKLKKNTALFFGVHEESEKERPVWLDRRKRLASRRCGQLKAEYQSPSQAQTPLGETVKADSVTDGGGRLSGSGGGAVEQPCPLRQKPSVASMTFKGVAILAAALNKQRAGGESGPGGGGPRGRRVSSTRSYSPPSTLAGTTPQSPIDDDVFFDRPSLEEPRPPPPTDFVDTASDLLGPAAPDRTRERHGSWKRSLESRREPSTQVGLSRISGIDLDRAHDNSDRKQYGQGIVHRLFSRSLKRSVISREPVKEQLEDLEDHRPYFTYWLSTVQILILVISLISYGFGPFGMDLTHQSGLVLVTSLSLQQVDYTEPANFWLGPRAADLIHLGAKFAPCMRRDAKIIKEIEKGRERERETACCIRNDDSGCVQLSKADCSSQISTWKKWGQSDTSSSGGRISGSVCGLDPKYCEAPASVAPYEWPDDITKWPICRKNVLNSGVQRVMTKDKLAAEHMVCEVIGHPCCIGIHATCKITTKEYCDFVHGTFHDEASLCSQVSCLDDVCGMIPFLNAEVPDQFYRLISSIFLHAGVIQLAISLWIQWLIMRDLEKLTGTARLMIIYIGSGIAGNLASAIFIPYRADVGPAGSQSGLLACLIVEILNMWPMLKHPYRALFKHLAIAGLLFLVGLLPWFDNFSSFFGFLFGFLLSYAILPFISVGEYDRQKKIFIIWVCLVTSAFLFLLLVLFFYVIPVYDCEICGYFNCLPLTRDFCSAQNIDFKRSDSPV